MPDLGMFGSPIGEVNYSSKLNTDADTLLRAAQATAIPGQIQERAALTRLHGAQAGEAELHLEIQRSMQDLLKRAYGGAPGAPVGPDGRPRTQADITDDLSRISYMAGDVKQGADLAGKASLIRMHDASAALSQVRGGVLALTAQQKEVDMLGRLLGDVTDQASWERANNLYAFNTNNPSPWAGVPYSPELVNQLQAAALTRKDQIQTQINSANAKSLRAFRNIRLRQHDDALALQERRLEIAEDREDRLAKTGGGKAVASPQTGEIQEAARLIKRDFGKLDATDTMNAAFSVAAEAKALRRQNPALDAETALQRAYKSARERGDFREIAATSRWSSPTQRFTGGGRTPETAVAAPPDPAQRVLNRYYSVGDKVYQWSKEGAKMGWRPISGGLPENNADENDEEDEED